MLMWFHKETATRELSKRSETGTLRGSSKKAAHKAQERIRHYTRGIRDVRYIKCAGKEKKKKRRDREKEKERRRNERDNAVPSRETLRTVFPPRWHFFAVLLRWHTPNERAGAVSRSKDAIHNILHVYRACVHACVGVDGWMDCVCVCVRVHRTSIPG